VSVHLAEEAQTRTGR